MKNLFSTIMNNSLYSDAKRLAMAVVFLFIAGVANAGTYYAKVTFDESKPSGAGHVYVTDNEPLKGKSNSGAEVTFDLTIDPAEGYYFEKLVEKDHKVFKYNSTNTQLTVSVSNSTGQDNASQYTFTPHFQRQHIVNKSAYVGVADNSYIDKEAGLTMGYVLVSTSDNESQAGINKTEMAINANNENVNGPVDYVTYYYYAKPSNENFKFKGWATDQAGQKIINMLSTYPQTSTATQPYPTVNTPQRLYAVFEINPIFHYEGPTADFATNYSSPRGQIYCDQAGKYYTDQTNLPWSSTKVVDAQQYQTAVGATEYYQYYYAQPNPGYTFKGWSTSKNGSNIISYDAVYKRTQPTMKDGAYNSSLDEEHPDPSYTLYAVFESYFYNSPLVLVADNSKGLGKVALKTPDSYPTNNAEWQDEITTRTKYNVPTNNNSNGHTYYYYYYVKPEVGAIFDGWSLTPDGENLIDIATTPYLTEKTTTISGQTYKYYEGKYLTTVTSEKYPHTPPTLYAVFSSLLDIKQQDRMIFYRDDQGNGYINDANILIELSDATTLTATLADDGMSRQYFQLFNETLSQKGHEVVADATTGLVQLRLNYKGLLSEALNPTPKKATIALTGKDSSGKIKVSRNVIITIEEAPIITFVPTDGKGEYTITHTDGSGIHYTMNTNSSQNIQVPINHENMAYMELNLNLDVNDDYVFYGWQIYENFGQDDETFTYISQDKLSTYRFDKAVTVKAEFIPSSWARYIIKSEPDVPYYDLAQVLKIADENIGDGSEYPDNKVVVVISQTGRLPLGSYTIPEGVAVLVPGDNAHTIKTTLGTDDYTTTGTKKGAYCTWTIESGTELNVKGTLYMYARLTSSTNPYSQPYQYGHMVMEEHCKITVANNAKLCVYGYMSGAPSASVKAQSGATVYETFQILDWRGGNATADMVLENFSTDNAILQRALAGAGALGYGDGKPSYQGVFPANHYYIQNIEIPVTFESGAKEKLSAGIYVGSLSVVEVPFIAENEGFFRLKSNTTLTKYYDVATDRIKYKLVGQSDDAQVDLGNLILDASITDGVNIQVDSKEYNMPLPPNYDILVENIEMKINYDILMLPGSSISVDRNSAITIDGGGEQYERHTGYSVILGSTGTERVRRTASLFVLDREWYNRNYYGAVSGMSQYAVINVGYRPGGAAIALRAIDSDAKVVVDGKIILVENNGYIYTTSTTAADKSNYGANITSNGGGSIQFADAAPENIVLQATQNNTDISYVELPITMAKLHNALGDYTTPNPKNTYYYCDGTWSTDECLKPNIPVVDYTPYFTAETMEFTGVYVGEGAKNLLVNIEEQNSQITPAEWNTIEWSGEISGRDKNLFTFTKDANGKPAVDFNPISFGNKNALLMLTATFTKAGDEYVYTKPILLTANALNQLPNNLAFADLTKVYVGQANTTSIFATTGSAGAITLTIKDKDGNEVNPTTLGMGIANATSTNATIKPLASATTDTFTIEATQVAKNHIQPKTISTELIVNPLLVWNWSELYYPSANNRNPITVMDGSTDWTLTEKIVKYDVVQFTGTTPDTYEAELYDLIMGEYEVMFGFCNQHDADTDPNDTIWFRSSIFRDPRYVRVEVNNPRTYKAITVGKSHGVSFDQDENSSVVYIESLPNKTNAWTIHFLGIPDKLSFKPTGDKAWQIEESEDGITWTTTFTWATIPENEYFEHSLMPSTQYVRINYAANDEEESVGGLENVVISKLEGVKFTPSKLYMPAAKGQTKNVAITYVSDKDVTITSPTTEFEMSPNKLSSVPLYNVADVIIENDKCLEQKLTGVNVTASIGTEIIPIQTYTYPQQLPIVLSSDMPAERFYYVTTHTYNTIWDEETRTITMHNAVAKAQPYATFYFSGSPTFISFEHNAGLTKGQWIIQESLDGINWTYPDASNEDVNSETFFKKIVSPAVNSDNAKYIRVTYKSLYTSKVDIKDLRIIGEEGAFVDKTELTVEYENSTTNSESFTVTAINLENGMRISTNNNRFKLSHGDNTTPDQNFTLDATTDEGIYAEIFKTGAIRPIDFRVYFDGTKAVDYTTITITNNPVGEEELKIFATIQVTGICKTLTPSSKFYTGVPDGTDGEGNNDATVTKYTLKGSFEGSKYRPLAIKNAFANGNPIFDYLYVFGETTTMDGTTTITTPTTLAGSNAKTPCYIYEKINGGYQYVEIVENANNSVKIKQDFLSLTANTEEIRKIYIAGFCPYASTGYTKEDEGVFCFRGGKDDEVHVYLQDCYLYSRSKTDDGHYFEGRYDGNAFTEQYVRGSGAVLVFECLDSENTDHPFKVSIHTRGSSLFKSHYGCFLESMAGRAFQVSAPVQIHMATSDYVRASETVLNFDDIWPNEETGIDERTNGFLSLQKQVNNAPSIDLGNSKTIVNFNGGQVELQNAINVSDNYNSTLAISYRGGRFAGFFLAHGLGSDEVTGTVNFNDGTTTVITMDVPERYRQYYLMDENGTSTSCLRTPKDTYVFGGSHCMMRACEAATSKGGAPTDGTNPLGLYQYPHMPDDGHKGGWSEPDAYGLVTPTQGNAPDNYNHASVTPNDNGTPADPEDDYLNFWVPEGYDTNAAKPEVDQIVSFWRACMTYIEASFSLYGGHVGGDVVIQTDKTGRQTELVSNLLYCEIDQSIHEVIRDNYAAPVKSPLPEGDPYLYIKPSKVGDKKQHYILNNDEYRVENKVYYITTATADVWTSFTAPFDVKNIYIMETRHEAGLAADAQSILDQGNNITYRDAMLKMQAKHNADFAAFFGVAMVIHPNKTFDQIFADYRGWAYAQDGNEYNRNKYPLNHFYKKYNVTGEESYNNWDEADYYLYKNNGEWTLTDDEKAAAAGEKKYTAQWDFVVPSNDEPLMRKGETYTMLFPYCVGCFDDNGKRDFWDYWSGKFLIFESTDGPHDIKGSSFVGATATYEMTEEQTTPQNVEWLYNDELETSLIDSLANKVVENGDKSKAIVSGNSTFAMMQTMDMNVLGYVQDPKDGGFMTGIEDPEIDEPIVIEPAKSFLYTNLPSKNPLVSRILRDGTIIYNRSDNSGNQNGTSGLTPTVGGGNDLFITAIDGGINIAVAEPQMVKVMSSTGAVLFAGYITTATDVQLPTHGIYIVSGENEVQKIMH